MSVRHIDPDGLHCSPTFSQAVVVEQPAKPIYIGGHDGKPIGPHSRRAFRDLATILESEGATLANIVH
ncbi:hypothetical protein DFJ69_6432 [Thermomonospora umbrina]|uniref:Uncharacterized protein n=2 Tax=Thermomonospora umbrina TaxID=111806 RepID=A0A3D9SZ31_9ACTN|nr:hypothetical protein DFJ69_6432 [Thermomonospora umbrina]